VRVLPLVVQHAHPAVLEVGIFPEWWCFAVRMKKNNSRRFKGQVAPVFDNLATS